MSENNVHIPKFSILLPTKDRAELLTVSAIPSILKQSFDDFEIIVCDNASDDNTQEAVQALNDPRVKFFRTEEWIPKELFFEWCVQYASGEYSVWFFDDDAMTSTALEKMNDLTNLTDHEVITFGRNCVYFYPDYPIEDKKNLLVSPQFNSRAMRYNASDHLDEIYRTMDILLPTPMVSNAFFRTNLLKSLISKYGTLYPHGHMGDYNIACIMLANIEEFVYLDDPIFMFGHWSSNSNSQLHDLVTTMPEYKSWIEWVKTDLLKDMPWQEYIWPNAVAAAMNDMSNKYGLQRSVSKLTYYRALCLELERLRWVDQVPQLRSNIYQHILNDLDDISLADALNIKEIPRGHRYMEGFADIEEYAALRPHPQNTIIDTGRPYAKRGGDEFDSLHGALAHFENVTKSG